MDHWLGKLFNYDKNYILKEVQREMIDSLLNKMAHMVKEHYLRHYNPLGLEDDAILKIKKTKRYPLHLFSEFYWRLAAVYRYQKNSNQLELLFDGKSHHEKFSLEWSETFLNWVKLFCQEEAFIKAVLEAAIFFTEERKGFMSFNRLNHFLVAFFDVKITKRKGLIDLKAA